jgi:hypothetical protein
MEHDDAGEVPGSRHQVRWRPVRCAPCAAVHRVSLSRARPHVQAGGGAALLVGSHGGEFVRSALSTLDPAGAIEKVQQSGALRNPECEPLLGLLDHMGQSRAEARRARVRR